MAGDASGDSGRSAGKEGSDGADRPSTGEAGRPEDWRRVESERPERDAVRKAWDATHDPSPEFEHAARPLSDDYGRDRPQHRELTAQQRAELEEVFERPADELLAVREQDPRAGHNRDEAGRILDQDGNPRPERTTEQILGEAERQANLYGPDAPTDATNAPETRGVASDEDVEREPAPVEREVTDDQEAVSRPDLQAPSELPGEPGREAGASDTSDGGAGEAVDESDGDTVSDRGQHDGGDDNGNGDGRDRTDQGYPDDEPDDRPKDGPPAETNLTNDEASDGEAAGVESGRRALPPGLAERIDQVAADLKTGNLTDNEAADRVEQLRNAEQPAAPEDEPETNGTVPYDEPTTETVETKDGFTYERPERRDSPDVFEAPPGDQRGFKELKRVAGSGGHDLLDGMKELGNNMDGALQEEVVHSARPSWEPPQHGHVDGGLGEAVGSVALLAFAFATGVHAAKDRWDNRKSDTS